MRLNGWQRTGCDRWKGLASPDALQKTLALHLSAGPPERKGAAVTSQTAVASLGQPHSLRDDCSALVLAAPNKCLAQMKLTDRDLLVVLLITGQRRRGGGATRADCGCFAIAKSSVAGFEYQYGGGTWRRKSSSAAFIAAIVCAA